MKKYLCAFLTVLLLFALSLPAMAASPVYVKDNTGVLDESEIQALNDKAAQIYDTYGITLAYDLSADCGGKETDLYAEEAYAAGGFGKDGVLLVINDNSSEYYFYTAGSASTLFSEGDLDNFWDALIKDGTYAGGGEAYMDAAAAKMETLGLAQPGQTEQTAAPGAPTAEAAVSHSRFVDNANLLSEPDAAALRTKLDEISRRQQCDVVVVTVASLDGKSSADYADDYFDSNGYGIGKEKDGLLFLVAVNGKDRSRWISTSGYGITAFTDAGIDYILKQTRSEMNDGNYAAAFTAFADLCDQFLTQAKTGTPYDTGNLPKEKANPAVAIVLGLVIGAIVSLVILLFEKRKYKNVRLQPQAQNYIREGSLVLTSSGDTFLYSAVSRTERTQNHSGSSTHESSSGGTHGGGGDRF